ncbi:hypothetical protein ACPV5W_19520 [Vibrio astriarenae]
MNKKALAEKLGINMKSYDTFCWDFTFEDKVIFLIASNEIQTLWDKVELFYEVGDDNKGGRGDRCKLRNKNVLDVIMGKKTGYVLVRADNFLVDYRDDHQWKLVNGYNVFKVTGKSLEIDNNQVGWVDVDTITPYDIFTV